jgi:hypothetical protein
MFRRRMTQPILASALGDFRCMGRIGRRILSAVQRMQQNRPLGAESGHYKRVGRMFTGPQVIKFNLSACVAGSTRRE